LLPRGHRKNKTQKKHDSANRYTHPKAASETVRTRVKESLRPT
jgi:hypothetical protein